jgi:serine/threonine protein phosphatase PrpC
LLEELEICNNLSTAILKTFERTQLGCKEFLIQTDSLNRRMGSTGVIGLLAEDKLYIANVGDSRAVLSRKGQAIRTSVDHKPLNRDERQRIRDLGGM